MELIEETNGSALHSNEEAFVKALEEKGIIDRELAQALYANRQEISNLVSEEKANVNSINGLKESLYSSSIDQLFGEEIAEQVSNDAYIGPVESYLSTLVAEATEKGISLEQALLNIQKDFTVNSEAYINEALTRAKENLTNNLVENRFGQVSPETIQSTVSG